MPSHSAQGVFQAPRGLQLIPATCCVCGHDEALPVGLGEDFEYRTSSDTFLAVQCQSCRTVYLNPRPAAEEFNSIYPPEYHAFDFSPRKFGWIYRIRQRLEARRLLDWCRGLPPEARILDVGCGDGFHLQLLRDFGTNSWVIEGVDADPRAVQAARSRGLTVHHGDLRELNLPAGSFDMVLLIMTIEHVAQPNELLGAIARVLKPGGRVVVVTDNTASPSFRLFGGRYWGGYHFPRHFFLFDRHNLARLGQNASLAAVSLRTAMSPVNWCYSAHNLLADWEAPPWLVRCFTLRSFVALSVLTMWDALFVLAGRGSILHAVFQKANDREQA